MGPKVASYAPYYTYCIKWQRWKIWKRQGFSKKLKTFFLTPLTLQVERTGCRV